MNLRFQNYFFRDLKGYTLEEYQETSVATFSKFVGYSFMLRSFHLKCFYVLAFPEIDSNFVN